VEAWTARKRIPARLEARPVKTDAARKRDPVRKRCPNQACKDVPDPKPVV
jgi:hypothetical protein